MRTNRFGFALTIGMSVLTLGIAQGATAQAAQSTHLTTHQTTPRSAMPPAVGSITADAIAANASYRTTAFTNNDQGQCLDGDTNTIGNNGAKVQLWACNGWSNQSWVWTPAPNLPVGYYVIQNYDQGQCLDGDTNTIGNNGAKVQLWGCNGWSNQVWIWNGSTLKNYDQGQCLDGDTNTIGNNGAKVQLWACNGWTNQSWTWH
ncbi:hypothetical protein P3T36_004781 [Kitasatospora sp. MAP12-15]|uniref:RICIN domain-containing protein n=1 Tax=unclassified Kitasatospora TaxID=2633591 RepID=UPI002473B1F0|nr:RICIN domain-containing protein [Kitasatospora sp. MAP12-44]MDH6110287.1 hypothetical protein [Kitasatospora sp. MAP12-44]